MSGIMLASAGAVRRPPGVTITADTYTRPANTASFTLNSDGNLYATDGGASSLQYAWLLSGFPSFVDVKVDLVSGSYSSGTTGTWLNLSTTRAWTINWGGGMSVNTVVADVTLRDASTHVQLDTAQITITASP